MSTILSSTPELSFSFCARCAEALGQILCASSLVRRLHGSRAMQRSALLRQNRSYWEAASQPQELRIVKVGSSRIIIGFPVVPSIRLLSKAAAVEPIAWHG